jgi:magnesium transporter
MNVDNFKQLIELKSWKSVKQELGNLESVQIAEIIEGLSKTDQIILFRILPRNLAKETFKHLSLVEQEDIIEGLAFNVSRLSKLLNDLDPDDHSAFFEEVPGEVSQRLVTDTDGTLLGIVMIDNVIDVVQEENTEDFQKFGGTEGLDMSYTKTSLFDMVKKRAVWLIILFLSEMLTASAMGYFDDEIAKAVVLALFVPLIISSGGNSGSQAASLIIRSLALGELKLRNWWYVMRKEILSGLCLGSILGIIGFIRIFIWQKTGLYDYGEYWIWIGASVSVSLVFIVLWGTIAGSMIPFILKKVGLDPATASAPFVATLVDVTGLIIYFSVAALFLSGKLL